MRDWRLGCWCPPEPLELWESPPFEPTIRNGRIYARGIGDNKGQHFAQLLAIESHLAVNGELPCNVIFLLEGEEEIGSPHIADFVREHADRLKADLVCDVRRPASRIRAPGHHLRRTRRGGLRTARQDCEPRRAFRQFRRRRAERHLEAGPPPFDHEEPVRRDHDRGAGRTGDPRDRRRARGGIETPARPRPGKGRAWVSANSMRQRTAAISSD